MGRPLELKWQMDSEKRYILSSYYLLHDQHNYTDFTIRMGLAHSQTLRIQ